MRTGTAILTLLLTVATVACAGSAAEVQALFAEHCLSCHGGVKKQGGLSFIRKAEAFAKGDSGLFAIVPGKPAESELLARVAHRDPDERMPPEGAPLRPEQIAALEAWIKDGAEWPAVWSLAPIAKAELGDTDEHDIDFLVRSTLRQHGVKPAPPADRRTLLRRLSLDLTGLPPTPEQVDTFLADNEPGATERVVDRLLASPHFGEQWARHWLDLARYADSDGYEKDNARPNAWRWRDWVIRAINADMPFDQFTVEQLAGDLLPEATAEQRLATGFHLNTLLNREGGIDQEEDRVKRTVDRVNTTAATWYGLTVGCAQCHDHPYDPVSQREFYQLYAFFNEANDSKTKVARESPEALAAKRGALTAQLEARKAAFAGQFDDWLAAAKPRPKAEDWRVEARASAEHSTFEIAKNARVSAKTKANTPADTYTIEIEGMDLEISGIRLFTFADKALPGKGPGQANNGNYVLSEFEVEVDGKPLNIGHAESDYNQKNYEIAKAVDGTVDTFGWAVGGQTGRDHRADFWFDEPVAGKGRTFVVRMRQHHHNHHFIGRFQLKFLTGTPDAWPDRINALVAKGERSKPELDELRAFAASASDAEAKTLQQQLAALDKNGQMDAAVLAAAKRDTFIFHRGDFLQPNKEAGKVVPGTPAVLPSLALRGEKADSADRLDFARWLVSAEHPLTARVQVNRIWQRLFGQGLADTPDDFGIRGEAPLHPELLDWLADEFRSHWSRKKLIKTIVLSETYQQSSAHRQDLAQRDPDNRWLARQNRFRVPGENVRDLALSAAGLLSNKVGGPSVFPPIPADVAKQSYANNFKWKTSGGEDRYRRGMYTFLKRTALRTRRSKRWPCCTTKRLSKRRRASRSGF